MLLDRLTHLVPTREQLASKRCLRWLGPLLLDPQLWRWSRRGVARGVSIGVFFGLLIPVAQIPLAVIAAIALRACVPAAVTSTFVTNPVTFAPVYYAAYRLGVWITADPAAAVEQPGGVASEEAAGLWQSLGDIGWPLLVGLTISATVAALCCHLTIHLVWRWLERHRRRRDVPHQRPRTDTAEVLTTSEQRTRQA
ncbi:MAG: hypothetical protein AW08_02888 [Candidatus Accumulibacter adjunctus]|mgnify:CR=1 FL=1|uniref:DUF2062 domain-containing protein n=1 Tax=Candidatus Accumulibacter adjunctus TaxID=1454001 RepID=A0A011M847_9PROT|nr:MAG: hypothetical protein AW08_02888 [Candidatus Accumulibacter adjunctus]